MSTDLKSIVSTFKGTEKQGPGACSEIHLTEFFGGKVNGLSVQLTIHREFVPLDKATVRALITS